MVRFLLNDRVVTSGATPGTVALDVIRREFNLRGTKAGCREGDCGACTVLLGTLGDGCATYRAVPSCLLPAGELVGRHIVTIEGLNGPDLTPVQRAMVDEGATQCGFCTPGFVMAITGFLLSSPTLSMDEAEAAIEGNICRCTGYASILRAVSRLIDSIGPALTRATDKVPETRARELVRAGVLPVFFLDAAMRLAKLAPTGREGAEPESPTLVAGGTDLFVQRPAELRRAELRFLGERPELAGIDSTGEMVVVGAATTVENLRTDPTLNSILPGWSDAVQLVSSGIVRNRATVGGNIVNASPIGDITVMLLALDATLVIEGDSTRRVPLASFFKAYKKLDLRESEIVTAVEFPHPAPKARFSFEKVSRRGHLDIAGVNSAAVVEADGLRVRRASLAAGGVACAPLLLAKTSELLAGVTLTPDVVSDAAATAVSEAAPITDVRGSAEYRSRLLRRLIIAHFAELFPSLRLEVLVT
jgi:xanthine dehydrogenase small subunit